MIWYRSKSWFSLFSLFAAVFSYCTFADEIEEAFPGYADLCGYPIVVSTTPTIAQAVIGAEGSKVIVIDPSLQAPEESFRRTFMIAHECAHHRMGHSNLASRQQRILSSRVVRDQELSADCWAAETLARAGQDRTTRLMADRFFRGGLYSPGNGYPSGLQRSTIIQQCAQAGREARVAPNAAN